MKKYSTSLLSALTILAIVSLFSCFTREGSSGKPLKWQMGVALYSFNRFSFPEALSKADSAGVKFVEGFFFHKLGKEFNGNTIPNLTDAEIKLMKGMLEKKGIRMKSIYAHGKTAAEWTAYFEFSRKMGIQVLTCEPDRQYWDLLDSLAGKYKMKIALHEHARGLSPYWHPDSVLNAIKGHPNFGACADLGHWARSGLDPVDCLKKLKGHVINVHVKDLDSFNNLKATDVVVGKGVLNYPAIIEELKRHHFTGLAYIESEGNWDNNLPDVKEALRYLSEKAK